MSWFFGNSSHQVDSSSSSRSSSKFSLQKLQQYYVTLNRSSDLAVANHSQVVEVIRSVAELIIYGDQHTEQLFDYFCEKNMLSLFLAMLNHPYCSNRVKIQIIQTASILVQNIRSEVSLYYMLSNNHINEMITHRYNFEDEELLAYYISFLKTISLKLNSKTIQFFFNDRLRTFPLYAESTKLFDHSDGMVRTAVRAITLNVFKVDDPAMLEFVLTGPSARYLEEVVRYVHQRCRRLHLLMLRASGVETSASTTDTTVAVSNTSIDGSNKAVTAAVTSRGPLPAGSTVAAGKVSGAPAAVPSPSRRSRASDLTAAARRSLPTRAGNTRGRRTVTSPNLAPQQNRDSNNPSSWLLKLEVAMTEQADSLYYLEDVLQVGQPDLERAVLDSANAYLFLPLLLASLLPHADPFGELDDFSDAQLEETGLSRSSLLKGSGEVHGRATTDGAVVGSGGFVHAAAVQLSELASGSQSLLGLFLLAQAFFTFSNPRLVNQLAEALFRLPHEAKLANQEMHEQHRVESRVSEQCDNERHPRRRDHNPLRTAFMGFLSHDDERHCLAATCVLYAVLRNSSTDKKLLEDAGLSPSRHRTARKLFARLTSPDGSTGSEDSGTSSLFAPSPAKERSYSAPSGPGATPRISAAVSSLVAEEISASSSTPSPTLIAKGTRMLDTVRDRRASAPFGAALDNYITKPEHEKPMPKVSLGTNTSQDSAATQSGLLEVKIPRTKLGGSDDSGGGGAKNDWVSSISPGRMASNSLSLVEVGGADGATNCGKMKRSVSADDAPLTPTKPDQPTEVFDMTRAIEESASQQSPKARKLLGLNPLHGASNATVANETASNTLPLTNIENASLQEGTGAGTEDAISSEKNNTPASLARSACDERPSPKVAHDTNLKAANIASVSQNSATKEPQFPSSVQVDVSIDAVHDYASGIVELLLRLLQRDPPLRPVAMRAVAKLLIELTFEERGSGPCLSPNHAKCLRLSYLAAAKRIQSFQGKLPPDLFLNIFEGEWQHLRKGPLKVDRLVNQPEVLLPLRPLRSRSLPSLPQPTPKSISGELNSSNEVLSPADVSDCDKSTLTPRAALEYVGAPVDRSGSPPLSIPTASPQSSTLHCDSPFFRSLLDKVPLEMRLPRTEIERARSAMQSFMVVRLLRSTLERRPDSILGTVGAADVDIQEGRAIDLRSCEYAQVRVVGNYAAALKLQPAYLVLVGGAMIIVEPDRTRLGRGTTRSVAPLHRATADIDNADPRKLHVTVNSHSRKIGAAVFVPASSVSGTTCAEKDIGSVSGKRWRITLCFNDLHSCHWAKDQLVRARSRLRAEKLRRVSDMLSDNW